MSFDDRKHTVVVGGSWLGQSGYLSDDLRRVEDWTMRAYGERLVAASGPQRAVG
jgi:hypothetical protein